jgi:hypothetical protein
MSGAADFPSLLHEARIVSENANKISIEIDLNILFLFIIIP